jgi:peptide chain release factor 2
LTIVTTADLAEQLAVLDATLRNIELVLDLDRMRRERKVLEDQAAVPNLWDDPAEAQKVTSRLSHIQSEISRVEKIRARLNDAVVLLELSKSEDDADAAAEASNEVVALHKAVDELEIRTLLSGEYDEREALVSMRSGAGGVDAADLAEMLLRL